MSEEEYDEELMNELLGIEEAKDTVNIDMEWCPPPRGDVCLPSTPKSKHLHRAKGAAYMRKKAKVAAKENMCPMQICCKTWREANNVPDYEASWFKVLAGDLAGFLAWLGYKYTDFPSIAHMISTLSAPGVINAYIEANAQDRKELCIKEISAARVRARRAAREKGNVKIPVGRYTIHYRTVPMNVWDGKTKIEIAVSVNEPSGNH